MANKTKYNIPSKSNNDQHTSNQRMHSINNSNLLKETKALEEVMQEMDYIDSKPQVKGTLIPSYCQEVKKYCKLLITYLLNSSSLNFDVKDTDKTDNIYNNVKSKVHDIRKGAYKLFNTASSEQPSDPSLLKMLQEGLQELSKEVQKLYKIVVDNLKKLAVKVGIREETILEKGLGFINNACKEAAHTIDKAANSSFVKDVVDMAVDLEVNTKERFNQLVKKQRNTSLKNKNARDKDNDHRSRNKNSSRDNNGPSFFL